MTPKTDTDIRFVGRSDLDVVGREPEVPPTTGWDHRRARVAWSHVLPFAIVLGFANCFWIIVLRGAVGAIERTSAPFSTWLHESTLLVPVYLAAVLVAFHVAQRWFGPRPHGIRAVSATLALVAAAASAAGTLLLAASSWFDYRLQSADLHHMSAAHPGCDSSCLTARIHATGALEVKARWIGLLLMLVTDLVLIGLIVAFRGGDIVLARPPRSGKAPRFEDARLVLAAGLVGAGVIHAAVIPEHLDEWLAAGIFFVVLALAEVGAAGAVLARSPAWRVPALLAAVVVAAGPLVVWTGSRTAGMPFGPEAGEPEGIGVADVLSCALELTTLTIALVLLLRHRAARPWSRYAAAVGLTAVLAATAIGVGGADLPVVGAFSHLGGHHEGAVLVPEG